MTKQPAAKKTKEAFQAWRGSSSLNCGRSFKRTSFTVMLCVCSHKKPHKVLTEKPPWGSVIKAITITITHGNIV